jgi:hypothetical protein
MDGMGFLCNTQQVDGADIEKTLRDSNAARKVSVAGAAGHGGTTNGGGAGIVAPSKSVNNKRKKGSLDSDDEG